MNYNSLSKDLHVKLDSDVNLTGLPNLVCLKLKHAVIKPSVFTNMLKLRSLDLEICFFSKQDHDNLFTNLGNLEALSIKYAWETKKKIEYFSLNLNSLSTLERFKWLHLSYIKISEPNRGFLRKISDRLHVLKLRDLRLDQTSFEEFFDNTQFPLLELVELKVPKNVNLRTLVNQFPSIKELNIAPIEFNDSREFGGQISHLVSLEGLTFYGNLIHCLDHECFALVVNLKQLSLSQSVLRGDCESPFACLRSLEKLRLVQVSQSVPFGGGENFFKGLDSLKELYLNENHLRQIHPNALSNLSKLESLDLIENVIIGESLDARFFSGLRLLKRLNMEYNSVREINEDSFNDLVSLEELYIRANGIEEMVGNCFSNNRKLRKLDLSYNPVVDQFDVNVLSGLTSVELIGLRSSNRDLRNMVEMGKLVNQFDRVLKSNNLNMKIVL